MDKIRKISQIIRLKNQKGIVTLPVKKEHETYEQQLLLMSSGRVSDHIDELWKCLCFALLCFAFVGKDTTYNSTVVLNLLPFSLRQSKS